MNMTAKRMLARSVLAIPFAIVAMCVTPIRLALALVDALEKAYSRLELWVVYDGDEEARHRAYTEL